MRVYRRSCGSTRRRAVQAGRVGAAAAAGLAAPVGADGERARQGEAGGGELGGDLVAGRALARRACPARPWIR